MAAPGPVYAEEDGLTSVVLDRNGSSRVSPRLASVEPPAHSVVPGIRVERGNDPHQALEAAGVEFAQPIQERVQQSLGDRASRVFKAMHAAGEDVNDCIVFLTAREVHGLPIETWEEFMYAIRRFVFRALKESTVDELRQVLAGWEHADALLPFVPRHLERLPPQTHQAILRIRDRPDPRYKRLERAFDDLFRNRSIYDYQDQPLDNFLFVEVTDIVCTYHDVYFASDAEIDALVAHIAGGGELRLMGPFPKTIEQRKGMGLAFVAARKPPEPPLSREEIQRMASLPMAERKQLAIQRLELLNEPLCSKLRVELGKEVCDLEQLNLLLKNESEDVRVSAWWTTWLAFPVPPTTLAEHIAFSLFKDFIPYLFAAGALNDLSRADVLRILRPLTNSLIDDSDVVDMVLTSNPLHQWPATLEVEHLMQMASTLCISWSNGNNDWWTCRDFVLYHTPATEVHNLQAICAILPTVDTDFERINVLKVLLVNWGLIPRSDWAVIQDLIPSMQRSTATLLEDHETALVSRRRRLQLAQPSRVDHPLGPDPPAVSPFCIICHENERCVTFKPCAHYVACWRCTAKLETCPCCRSAITELVETKAV